MALPTDPLSRRTRMRSMAPQDRATCPWCLGAGKYLEPLASNLAHEYLPVVCPCCAGTGARGTGG